MTQWWNDPVKREAFRKVDEEQLVPPKRFQPNTPDWAMVALAKWDEWLRFWGIDSYREHPQANNPEMIQLGTPPPSTEKEALTNLTIAAAANYRNGRALQVLTPVERGLLKLERYFMMAYQKRDFRAKYGELETHQRFAWVAKQVNMGTRTVRDILEEVSLVMGEFEIDEMERVEIKRIDQQWRDLVREAICEAA